MPADPAATDEPGSLYAVDLILDGTSPHSLGLDDDHTWSGLAKVYEKVDPLAVLPIHQRLVETAGRCRSVSEVKLGSLRLLDRSFPGMVSGSPPLR